jgi:hypothetical protein
MSDDTIAVLECSACGRSHSGRDAQWCSPRCREASNNGWPRYRPVTVEYFDLKGRPMTARGDGFGIKCRCCGGDFVSKGLRCCSPDCERLLRQREDNRDTLAELEIAPSAKRKCEDCQTIIPKWTAGGKLTKKSVRFCPKCQRQITPQMPGRLPSARTGVLSR